MNIGTLLLAGVSYYLGWRTATRTSTLHSLIVKQEYPADPQLKTIEITLEKRSKINRPDPLQETITSYLSGKKK